MPPSAYNRTCMRESSLPASGARSEPRPLFRPWFLVSVLVTAAMIGWAVWPSAPEVSALERSRADGKPRFYATTYPKLQLPPSLTLLQRLRWEWAQFKRQYRKRNPAAYTFPASPVRPCGIDTLLTQCMEVTGTRFLISVEIAGVVDFGHSKALNGAQWVAAVEQAIETNKAVVCYDYGKRRNFLDKLLLIHERPGLVKVVPRSKLAEYEKAGLVKAAFR